MTTEIKEEFLLTGAEAVKVIRKAPTNSRFAVYIRSDAPIIDNPGNVFPYGCNTYLSISKRDAKRLVKDMLPLTLEDRGGRIKLKYYENTNYLGKVTRSYWIG